jgi:DNA-binding NarL/FixJ family response regulator
MTTRVAVVEDNAELRDSLFHLVSSGASLICVGTFERCEALLSQAAALRPDVVLMDIGLPGMSGIEGVRALKLMLPAVDVLMLTVYEDEESIFRAIQAGATGYILKKSVPRRLLEAIREIHSGGAPMTPAVARKVLAYLRPKAGAAAAALSPREGEILVSLVDGLSYKMIADRHFIAVDTVRSHLKSIYEKLHVHSKSEAVAAALKRRIL